MNVVLHIPDDFAEQLGGGGDVERQALEALALESYRAGRLNRAQMRSVLGFGSPAALDAFLVVHGVVGTFTEADLARDRQDLLGLGL
jgi:hypothetical protein